MADNAQLELKWSQLYEIGHERIDQQHAKLFELFNMIAEAYHSGLAHKSVEPALEELLAYTHYHFNEEERLMERLGYTGFYHHRESHQQLFLEVQSLAADFKEGEPVMLFELLSLLKNWLINHILHEDMKLQPLLANW